RNTRRVPARPGSCQVQPGRVSFFGSAGGPLPPHGSRPYGHHGAGARTPLISAGEMTVPLSGTSPVPDRDRLLELTLALSAATPLLARLEQVTLAALELTGTDHADLTVFDPLLRRFLPRHRNRVFLRDGDEEAPALITQHRRRLPVERAADAGPDADLMLPNRDIPSYLGVPALVHRHVEAALLVFSKDPRAFDAGE